MRHREIDPVMEELRATRFALAFMSLMWMATVTCLILWAR